MFKVQVLVANGRMTSLGLYFVYPTTQLFLNEKANSCKSSRAKSPCSENNQMVHKFFFLGRLKSSFMTRFIEYLPALYSLFSAPNHS